MSVTSTAQRLPLLRHTVNSIKYQVRRPDWFVVALSRDSFLQDAGLQQAPSWLTRAVDSIEWVPNTGPYRKLLPAISLATEEDIIVTIDDDVIYDDHWLRNVKQMCEEYPEQIVAARGRRIAAGPYLGWPHVRLKSMGGSLLPIGAGGIAYRKRLLNGDFLFDRAALDIAPASDDLWFRAASLIARTRAVVVPHVGARNGYVQHGHGLENDNVGLPSRQSLAAKAWTHASARLKFAFGRPVGNNDKAWRDIVRYTFKAYGVRLEAVMTSLD